MLQTGPIDKFNFNSAFPVWKIKDQHFWRLASQLDVLEDLRRFQQMDLTLLASVTKLCTSKQKPGRNFRKRDTKRPRLSFCDTFIIHQFMTYPQLRSLRWEWGFLQIAWASMTSPPKTPRLRFRTSGKRGPVRMPPSKPAWWDVGNWLEVQWFLSLDSLFRKTAPYENCFRMNRSLDVIALPCKIECFGAIFKRCAGQKCVELPAVLRSGDERSHDFNP